MIGLEIDREELAMSDTLVSLMSVVTPVLPGLAGWCSVEKAAALIHIVLETRPEVCVDVGTFGGSSLVPIAVALRHCGNGTVVGIDPWDNVVALDGMLDEKNTQWWGSLDFAVIKTGCEESVRRLNLEGRVKLVQATSADAVSSFDDYSVGLLHLDGNHSEAHSLQDVERWLPKVKTGGHIFFPDIFWTEGGTITRRSAVLRLLDSCQRVDVVKECLVVRKK